MIEAVSKGKSTEHFRKQVATKKSTIMAEIDNPSGLAISAEQPLRVCRDCMSQVMGTVWKRKKSQATVSRGSHSQGGHIRAHTREPEYAILHWAAPTQTANLSTVIKFVKTYHN